MIIGQVDDEKRSWANKIVPCMPLLEVHSTMHLMQLRACNCILDKNNIVAHMIIHREGYIILYY